MSNLQPVLTAITASGIIGSFVVSWRSLRITRRLEGPSLSLDVRERSKLPRRMEFVLHNHGRGIARDVKFEVPKKIKSTFVNIESLRAELEAYKSMQQHYVKGGFLTRGLSALPPGSVRTTTWADLGTLVNELGDNEYCITVRYKDDNGRKHCRSFKVNVAEFVGHKYQDNTVDMSLVNIADTLWRLESGQSRLHVVEAEPAAISQPEQIAKRRWAR